MKQTKHFSDLYVISIWSYHTPEAIAKLMMTMIYYMLRIILLKFLLIKLKYIHMNLFTILWSVWQEWMRPMCTLKNIHLIWKFAVQVSRHRLGWTFFYEVFWSQEPGKWSSEDVRSTKLMKKIAFILIFVLFFYLVPDFKKPHGKTS